MNEYDLELYELQEFATGKLLKLQVFNLSAFLKLKNKIGEIIELSKNDPYVSRQLLKTILLAANSIESQSDYVYDAKINIAMAQEFRRLIDVIALNESVNDRKPGIPKII